MLFSEQRLRLPNIPMQGLGDDLRWHNVLFSEQRLKLPCECMQGLADGSGLYRMDGKNYRRCTPIKHLLSPPSLVLEENREPKL